MTPATHPPCTPGPTGIVRPNLVNRVRSRQAGHPSGLLGRAIGRLMVRGSAAVNDTGIGLLDLGEPRTVLEDPSVYRFLSVDQVRGALDAAGFDHIVHEPGDTTDHNTHMFPADLPSSAPHHP